MNNWIFTLIEHLTEFLLYVVPGYLFLSVYRYILYKDENTVSQTANILLNSIIASFVLSPLYNGLLSLFHSNWGTSDYTYLIYVFVFCVLTGYLSASTITSRKASMLFEAVKINRTVHQNIWNDVLKPDMWIRIWLKESDKSYYGQVKYRENYGREPLIVLEYYQFLDEHATAIIDHTSDPKRTVLLNLTLFERIEMVER